MVTEAPPRGLSWRLHYPDGSVTTEAPFSEHQSIRHARRGASALVLVDRPGAPDGDGLISVALPPGWRPIFYRKRAADITADGTLGRTRTTALVWGRAREDGERGTAELWCVLPGKPGYRQPVPAWAFDETTVRLQLEG